MAKMPAAPMGEDNTDMTDVTPTDAAPEDTDSEPTVLLTVLDNGDGTFKLVEGDENEAIHDEDMAPEGAEPEQPGEDFDSPGPLLKAILDIIEKAQNGGEGTGEANFQAGFSGEDVGASTKKPMAPVPPAKKY